MFAIVDIAGKQYKIAPKDNLAVDKLALGENETFNIDKILLIVDNNNIHIGRPYLQGYQIKCTHIKSFLGDKIHIRKFKAKSRYRRHTGFRPMLSQIRIEAVVKNN